MHCLKQELEAEKEKYKVSQINQEGLNTPLPVLTNEFSSKPQLLHQWVTQAVQHTADWNHIIRSEGFHNGPKYGCYQKKELKGIKANYW